MWNKFTFKFANSSIEVYCREISSVDSVPLKKLFPAKLLKNGKAMEAAFVGAVRGKKKILYRELFSGALNMLTLDNLGGRIPWSEDNGSFEKLPSVNDWAGIRVEEKFMQKVDDADSGISGTLANAVNLTFADRKFTAKVKTQILGKWETKGATLEFSKDGTFGSSGKFPKGSLLSLVPKSGKWGIAANMLYMLDKHAHGARVLVFDISDRELVLPGYAGKIFYKLTRLK